MKKLSLLLMALAAAFALHAQGVKDPDNNKASKGQTLYFYGERSTWTAASITIDPDFLTVDAGMHYGDDFLPFTYENIIVENAQSFGLQFYTAEGEETGMPTSWFMAQVTPQTGNDAYQVNVATMPNDGEARSAYFKVYAYDADSTLVYSNLATVTQAAPVVPAASITIDPDFLTLDAEMHYGDDFLPIVVMR